MGSRFSTALIDLIERIAWYPCNLASGSRGCQHLQLRGNQTSRSRRGPHGTLAGFYHGTPSEVFTIVFFKF
jgi:hypothetical protein